MCCPVVPALRCEILIGQPQADAFDCPGNTCHVYIYVLTFTSAVQQCICEILRLEKCIGSYDTLSREIRKYVHNCQIPSVLHFFHHNPLHCTSVSRFGLPSIHFKSESRQSKNMNIVNFFYMTIQPTTYNKVIIFIQYFELNA